MSLAHADRVVSRPRRVYTAASAAPAEGGFAVALDGRPARTPESRALVLPTQALAALCAAEWEAQAREVDFSAMPATRLAFTTLDRAPATRDALAAEVARFAGGDTLAYVAGETPSLHARQLREAQPVLDWAAAALGVRLIRVEGFLHQPQPPETLARVRVLAAGEGDFALAGLAFAAALFGSAILAFALRHRRLTGEEAHDLARLEEAHNEAQWGLDAEAAARTAARLAEARAIAAWFRALG